MKKDKEKQIIEGQEKEKRSLVNLIFTIVQIVLIVVCVVASIFIIINPSRYSQEAEDCNTSIMVVMSDSMEPTIGTNDIIFGSDVPEGILPLGTVVTYAVKAYEGFYLNTHRIVGYYFSYVDNDVTIYSRIYLGEIKDFNEFETKYPECTILGYITRGDKYTLEHGASIEDPRIWVKNEDGSYKLDENSQKILDKSKDDAGFRALATNDVLAVWEGGRIGFIGTVIKFLQDPLAFGLIILLPLVLLFGYNIFLIVKMIIADKTEKARKAALEEANANKVDEEEIKRKAIEEYLASLNKDDKKD